MAVHRPRYVPRRRRGSVAARPRRLIVGMEDGLSFPPWLDQLRQSFHDEQEERRGQPASLHYSTRTAHLHLSPIRHDGHLPVRVVPLEHLKKMPRDAHFFQRSPYDFSRHRVEPFLDVAEDDGRV